MPYLLDTDIVIDYLTGDASTRTLVRSLVPAGISIGTIMYLEIYHGILEAPDPVVAKREFVAFLADVPVFVVDQTVAERRAHVRTDLTCLGKRVRSRALDLITAAIALEYGLTLVTKNKADYSDIPGLVIR